MNIHHHAMDIHGDLRAILERSVHWLRVPAFSRASDSGSADRPRQPRRIRRTVRRMGQLIAAIGDVHGRFERIEAWLREVGQVHGRPVDLAVAVGDLETFVKPDAVLRKRTKRSEPAEFGAYARGDRRMPCPLVFIGGNNEDFAALHAIPTGGELAPGVRYLGRAGEVELGGARAGFLSGIYAPTSYELPLLRPTNLELSRRAGHFRKREFEQVAALGKIELLLLHDWPRGICGRGKGAPPAFWGNAQARELVETLRPAWVLCGHQHRAWAATLGESRIACLADAERPETGLLWLQIEAGSVSAVGWGTSKSPAWKTGQPWSASFAPG
jgi:lariat debranching enzyme